jgi:hypothetical protein
MTTTSVSSARRRFLCSLPWLALSLSGALYLKAQRAAAQGALPAQQAAAARLRALLGAVDALGPPEAGALDLPDALAAVLDTLRGADARYGVRLATVALPGRGAPLRDGPADAQALASLAQPLASVAGLRQLRLEVRAAYRSYGGLKAWFAELETLPVSFQQVLLEDTQVQFSARVFGR